MIKSIKKNNLEAFTLIELLVVISIMGIVMALSVFGLQNARQSARDSKRKADLEQIRSGLEMYRADCGSYPVGSGVAYSVLDTSNPGSLRGNGNSDSCSLANVYISSIPLDPVSATHSYIYYSLDGSTYQLCSSLEAQGGTNVSCGTIVTCGTTGVSCNYKVTSP